MLEYVPTVLRENADFIPYFSLLIIFTGAFSYIGSIIGGSLLIPYEFPTFFAVFPFLLVFSFLFTEFSSKISSGLGHKTYFTSEERIRRTFLVFVLFSIPVLLAYFNLLLAFLAWFFVFYASVAVAVDGATFLSSLRSALDVFKKPYPVLELFAIIFLLYAVITPVDAYGGLFGTLFASLFSALFVTPFIIAHGTLTYLRKYPLVIKALEGK